MKQLQFLQHSTLFPLLIYICFLINGYDKIMSVIFDASFLYHQPFDQACEGIIFLWGFLKGNSNCLGFDERAKHSN